MGAGALFCAACAASFLFKKNMSMPKPGEEPYNLKGKSIHELELFFRSIGEAPYRARQAFRHINAKLLSEISAFSDFPLALRRRLQERHFLPQLQLLHRSIEKKKKRKLDYYSSMERRRAAPTEKYIFELPKGPKIETVWIPAHNARRTVCLSSQAGCALRCSFCATALLPFQGNLEAWEILEQLYSVLRLHPKEKLSNVVFMGMGEPFYNYENVICAARIIHHPLGLGLGARHITISTAGVLPFIERFIRKREPFTLAISLNHSNEEGRGAIMDINRKYPMSALLQAARRFTKELDRPITFEYVMIPGVNMSKQSARELIKIAHSVRCKINLIPLNTQFHGWPRPNPQEIHHFQSQLLEANVPVFHRGSPGLGIQGACGMLALQQ